MVRCGEIDSRRLSFARRSDGNVASMFALSLVPLIFAGGAALDYGRASGLRAKLAASADAAALAAAQKLSETPGARRQAALDVLKANFGDLDQVSSFRAKVTDITNGVQVEAQVDVKTSLLAVVGTRSIGIAATSAAVASGQKVEIALVLDNTGSMRNDMQTLRDATRDFTDTILNAATSGNAKLAIVPFVAAVNPGIANLSMSWLDTGASSAWHGVNFRSHYANWMKNCTVPSSGGSGGGGSGGGAGPTGPGGSSSGDRQSSLGAATPYRVGAVVRKLLGIASAQAQEVTPNTRPPVSGRTVFPPASHAPTGTSAFVPDGWIYDDSCNLWNPPKVSHFDLFGRIPNVRWKGCVEARPEPFDVTDEVPSGSNPNSLFVPYFWPDEPDPDKYANRKFNNNYMADGTPQAGWNDFWEWESFVNLHKYNTVTPASKAEAPPQTAGPNASCPDPIQPLTNKRGQIISKIAGLSHWDGGGTITSEGIMWGWRVLSPGAPFTEGAAYGQARKIMVVMSDGVNGLAENVADWSAPTVSDYSAYGYLRSGRFAEWTFGRAEDHLNDRMALACENAKKAGIEIYTVLFRENNTKAVNAMKACATTGKHFYIATSQSALLEAFAKIAGEIGQLRLVR